MNKKLGLTVLIIIMAVLVFSLYKITGNIIKDRGTCIDSDNTSFYLTKDEQSFFTKGNAKYENSNTQYDDVCVRGAKLKEYYCDHAGIIRSVRTGCPNGCKDGVCIK